MLRGSGPVYKEWGLPKQVVHLSTNTFPLFFHFVGGGRLSFLSATVTLVGELTFTLVNTPGMVDPPTWVSFLIVSRPFEFNHILVLSCRWLYGPTWEILVVNLG